MNPVIAGSFALSVFKCARFYNTDDRFFDLVNRIKKSPAKNLDIHKFNDIDIWFLSDNENSIGSVRLKSLVSDNPPMLVDLGSEKKLNLKSKSKWANTYSLSRPYTMNPTGPKWVSSFASKYGSSNYQFIRSDSPSVGGVLRSFDFVNSSIAWHDNHIYYDTRIIGAFKRSELLTNSLTGFKSSSIATRLFNGLRAFKYAQRYGIGFSEDLSSEIFRLYCDSIDIDYLAYDNKVFEIQSLYGKKLSSVDTLKSMASSFHRCFGIFITMDNFKPEYAAYLIDSSDTLYGLKKYINGDDSSIESIVPF